MSVHYLDHHSTTPCLPEVVDAMLPYFTTEFGNPAAITHEYGRRAGKAVEHARRAIAAILNVEPSELYFTSGATESNNIALRGLQLSAGDHVLVSAVEHRSVYAPLEQLAESTGAEVETLPVNAQGVVQLSDLADRIRSTTRLVTVMTANGEVGAIQPVVEVARLCANRNIHFHTDATQAVGRIETTGVAAAASTFAFSAHKFYGPKGIGGLVLRRGVFLQKIVSGGGQERGLRSGTVNVPGVIGMARALEIASRDQEQEAARLTALCSDLAGRLLAVIPDTFVHGPAELRLPGNLNVSFSGLDAEALMLSLRRFALSSGAACSSADREPSHVLRAMGVDRDLAMSSIRIGMGRSTTAEVVNLLVADLRESVERLRQLNA